jgi:hypothetical protein
MTEAHREPVAVQHLFPAVRPKSKPTRSPPPKGRIVIEANAPILGAKAFSAAKDER